MMDFNEWWEHRHEVGVEARPWLTAVECREIARRAFEAGVENAPLPASIQEALNSGDGTYRP